MYSVMQKTSIKKIPCPIAKVAHILSDVWTILIIRDLLNQEKRFSELARSLEEVSTRTLTLKLKRLQKMGLVKHKQLLYTLSPQGKKLEKIIFSMSEYGKKYLKEKNT